MSNLATTPEQLVKYLEQGGQAHEIVYIMQIFWPTIKQALLDYNEKHPEPVEPLKIPLD